MRDNANIRSREVVSKKFAGVIFVVGLLLISFPVRAQADSLYAVDRALDGATIFYKYASDGSRTTFATFGNLSFSVEGLAVDSAGNVFAGVDVSSTIFDFHHYIYKFTPGGTQSLFATPDYEAGAMAIAVPESSVWSLMAGGAALLSVVLARRYKQR